MRSFSTTANKVEENNTSLPSLPALGLSFSMKQGFTPSAMRKTAKQDSLNQESLLPDIGALFPKPVEEKCDSQFLFELDNFLEQKHTDRVIEEADEENDEAAVSLESEHFGHHVETTESDEGNKV